ncbi:MAG: hypothetical protein AAFN80_15735 [Pseudomonadota bacterium]
MIARNFIRMGEVQAHPGPTGWVKVYAAVDAPPGYYIKVDSGDIVPAEKHLLRQIKHTMGEPPRLRQPKPGEIPDVFFNF